MTAAEPDFLGYYTAGRHAECLRDRRLAGTAPLTLAEIDQPAGDVSEPAISDLLLFSARTRHAGRLDLGAGRFARHGEVDDHYLVAPQTATDVHMDAPQRWRVLALPKALALSLLADANTQGRHPLDFGRLHAGAFRSRVLDSVLDRLWDEDHPTTPGSRLFADGAVLTILGELLNAASRPAVVPKGGLAGWQFKRACDYMLSNLGRDIGLTEIAETVGLSTAHFCRAFSRTAGQSPHAWLTAWRMRRAQELLMRPEATVIAVALELGYEHPGHFARVFRRAFGQRPSEWRRDKLPLSRRTNRSS